MTKEEKVKEIITRLSKIYPHPQTALQFKTPLQLLISTMLSAQTTDKVVNLVTPSLFEKYKSANDFANASLEELNNEVKRINFHYNKAKNIKAACIILVEKFGGKVPSTMEDLDSLPGVARKTANVVLGNAFHKAEGIAVDTHVMRLSKKLGLTEQTDPVKIEKDLMKIVPKEKWTDFSHYLIYYGREYSPARPHKDDNSPLQDLYMNN